MAKCSKVIYHNWAAMSGEPYIMVPAGTVLIYPDTIHLPLLHVLSPPRGFPWHSLCGQCFSGHLFLLLFLFVWQEESSVKPEEQGPCSRFGPSTEDLTKTSKQVRHPYGHYTWGQFWYVYLMSYFCFPRHFRTSLVRLIARRHRSRFVGNTTQRAKTWRPYLHLPCRFLPLPNLLRS